MCAPSFQNAPTVSDSQSAKPLALHAQFDAARASTGHATTIASQHIATNFKFLPLALRYDVRAKRTSSYTRATPGLHATGRQLSHDQTRPAARDLSFMTRAGTASGQEAERPAQRGVGVAWASLGRPLAVDHDKHSESQDLHKLCIPRPFKALHEKESNVEKTSDTVRERITVYSIDEDYPGSKVTPAQTTICG
ncbi:hypothetical protein RRG08_005311 [Elysia crispata]|uniref:Uncharacterized protein n=1 Tax=Elysia crispata TaxID=231223 RepID=A0AAE0YZW4_9GAST|nr:hypothetical protein RRG08_005311 [Elysia crispata]